MIHLKMDMREFWESKILIWILVIMGIILSLRISPQPRSVEKSFLETGRALSFKNYQAAAENLVQVVGYLPSRLDLWEEAGNYALLASDAVSAVRYYQEAAKMGVLSPLGYLMFGDAYAQSGNLYTAVQIWDIASTLLPGDSEPLVRIADAYREMGDIPSLINVLKKLIAPPYSEEGLATADVNIIYELGLLLAAQNPEKAPPYLLQVYQRDSNITSARELAFVIQHALAYENPTYTLMVSGKKLGSLNLWDLALYAFHQVISSQPNYSEGWAFYGEALQHTDQASSGEVLVCLSKALETDPNSLSGNVFMALYWLREENLELAFQYLSGANELDRENSNIILDLGLVTALMGDLEKADEFYRSAVIVANKSPWVQQQYVNFLIRYDKDLRTVALPISRQLLTSDNDDPDTLDLMGQVLFRLGDLLTSERFFIQAIQQSPTFAPAYQHLGLVYSMQDKPDLADAAFSKANFLQSDNQLKNQTSTDLSDLFFP